MNYVFLDGSVKSSRIQDRQLKLDGTRGAGAYFENSNIQAVPSWKGVSSDYNGWVDFLPVGR